MQQPIIGFHQDAEGDWVADLACGHGQHVRHDPPWQVREWVLKETTRRDHLGTPLECVHCDRDESPAASAYEDARVRGLCHDGAREVAGQAAPPRIGTDGDTEPARFT